MMSVFLSGVELIYVNLLLDEEGNGKYSESPIDYLGYRGLCNAYNWLNGYGDTKWDEPKLVDFTERLDLLFGVMGRGQIKDTAAYASLLIETLRDDFELSPAHARAFLHVVTKKTRKMPSLAEANDIANWFQTRRNEVELNIKDLRSSMNFGNIILKEEWKKLETPFTSVDQITKVGQDFFDQKDYPIFGYYYDDKKEIRHIVLELCRCVKLFPNEGWPAIPILNAIEFGKIPEEFRQPVWNYLVKNCSKKATNINYSCHPIFGPDDVKEALSIVSDAGYVQPRESELPGHTPSDFWEHFEDVLIYHPDEIHLAYSQ